jgi:CO/xanthine dehydrogenase FAD-binding subunit
MVIIPFDFEYYRPDTLQEAVGLYQKLSSGGLTPFYYGGGTEIISMARLGVIHTGAVIDIKAIPECNILEVKDNQLVIGSAVTLTRIRESDFFPLLGKSGGRVADHTVRDKVTLGGNLCGKIIYREAVLPLLLTESQVVITGPGGERRVKIQEVFDQIMQLASGEMVVQFIIDNNYLTLPYRGIKKTSLDKIGYPLVTVAVIVKGSRYLTAVSGLCAFPFRSPLIEADLNDRSLPLETRVHNIINHLPAPILSDIHGSAEYREFVFKNTLLKMIRELD